MKELERLVAAHDKLVEAQRLLPVSGVGTYAALNSALDTAIGEAKEQIHRVSWQVHNFTFERRFDGIYDEEADR